MTPEEFVAGFVDHLHREAVTLRSYGAEAQATTCEKNADALGAQFRAFWLAELTIPEAAKECGYAADSLREMVREGTLPHRKAKGDTGSIIIVRADLPRRVKPKAEDRVTSLAHRLLRPREVDLRKPS
jgi:hypothetical protein